MTDIMDDLESVGDKRTASQNFQAPNLLEILRNNIQRLDIYFDKMRLWWIWDDKHNMWMIADETEVLLTIESVFPMLDLSKERTKKEMLNASRMVFRSRVMITPDVNWIQFKNKTVDILNDKEILPDKQYFFTNPIPHNLGKSNETPVMDSLILSWVGEQYKDMMYEIIAYCMYRDYPMHRIFCFTGSGRNGKSKFLGLINRIVGQYNTCSTDLDLLMNRPNETFKLYKKLTCEMGETNYEGLKRTAILKQLSGQDLISFEKKYADGFSDYNYAKLLISTNGIPITHDKSEGFYRRWMIIDFPNNFPEGKDILKSIPKEEYDNICRKSIEILPKLLDSGRFTNEGSIEDKKRIYEEKSNPLSLFLGKFLKTDYDSFIPKYEFRDKLKFWMSENGYRSIQNSDINSLMKDLYEENRKTPENHENAVWCWIGLSWIDVKDVKDVNGLPKVSTRVEVSEKSDSSDKSDINKNTIIDFVGDKVTDVGDIINYFGNVNKQKIGFLIVELMKIGDLSQVKPGFVQVLK